MNAIYTWMLLTAAFLVIEALTAGLTTIWFAGGSVVALILTFLGAPLWLQAAAFAAISLILFLKDINTMMRHITSQLKQWIMKTEP